MSTPRFTRNMTIEKRRKVRDAIREAEIERALRRAGLANLTTECRNAMAATGGADPEYARLLHQSCKGELPGASGCLCLCHDAIQEPVERGFAMGAIAQTDQFI